MSVAEMCDAISGDLNGWFGFLCFFSLLSNMETVLAISKLTLGLRKAVNQVHTPEGGEAEVHRAELEVRAVSTMAQK